MAFRIIHVLDTTTSEDAVEALSALLRRETAEDASSTHEVVVLGHRSTGALLRSAGVTSLPVKIHWVRSLGWMDPMGWRAMGRLVDPVNPTLLHAWGLSAAMACAVGGTSAGRVVTLAEGPLSLRPWLVEMIDRGSWRAGERKGRPVQWTGFTREVVDEIVAAGVPEERVMHVPLGVAELKEPKGRRDSVREALGLLPEDGPVFLVGGDARRQSRHDYGLWSGGIVQQMFPRVRVVVREDPRGRRDHGLERLLNTMGDPELPVVAPAELSWAELLTIADVMLVTADGPVPMGAALHAMMAGVPVVGTPIRAVREIIEDGRTGLVARSLRPRALAARLEEVMGDREVCRRLTNAARVEAREKHGEFTMVERLRSLYALGGAGALAAA